MNDDLHYHNVWSAVSGDINVFPNSFGITQNANINPSAPVMYQTICKILLDFIQQSAKINPNFSSLTDLVRLRYSSRGQQAWGEVDMADLMGLIIESLSNTIAMVQPHAIDPQSFLQIDITHFCTSHPKWKALVQGLAFRQVSCETTVYLPRPSPFAFLRSWLLEGARYQLSQEVCQATLERNHPTASPSHTAEHTMPMQPFFPYSVIPNTSQLDCPEHPAHALMHTNSLYVSSAGDEQTILHMTDPQHTVRQSEQPMSGGVRVPPKRRFGEDASYAIQISNHRPEQEYHQPTYQYLPQEAPDGVVPLVCEAPEIGSSRNYANTYAYNGDGDGSEYYDDLDDYHDYYYDDEYGGAESSSDDSNDDEASYRVMQRARFRFQKARPITNASQLVQLAPSIHSPLLDKPLALLRTYSRPLPPYLRQLKKAEANADKPTSYKPITLLDLTQGSFVNSFLTCFSRMGPAASHQATSTWDDINTLCKLLSIPKIAEFVSALPNQCGLTPPFGLQLVQTISAALRASPPTWEAGYLGMPSTIAALRAIGSPIDQAHVALPTFSHAPPERRPMSHVFQPAHVHAPTRVETTDSPPPKPTLTNMLPPPLWLHSVHDSGFPHHIWADVRSYINQLQLVASPEMNATHDSPSSIGESRQIWQVYTKLPTTNLDSSPLFSLWCFFVFCQELTALARGPPQGPAQGPIPSSDTDGGTPGALLHLLLDLDTSPAIYPCPTLMEGHGHGSVSYFSHILQASMVQGVSEMPIPLSRLTPLHFSQFINRRVMPWIGSPVRGWTLSFQSHNIPSILSTFNSHLTQLQHAHQRLVLIAPSPSLFDSELFGIRSYDLLRDCSSSVGGDLFSSLGIPYPPWTTTSPLTTYGLLDTSKKRGEVQQTLKQMFNNRPYP